MTRGQSAVSSDGKQPIDNQHQHAPQHVQSREVKIERDDADLHTGIAAHTLSGTHITDLGQTFSGTNIIDTGQTEWDKHHGHRTGCEWDKRHGHRTDCV